MEDRVRKILYYLVLPVFIVFALVYGICWITLDLEKSVGIASSIIQSTGILVAGLWAYNKFGWEKKAENALQLRALLFEYSQRHAFEVMMFHNRMTEQGKNKRESYTVYANNMFPAFEVFRKHISIAIFVPREMRDNIFKLMMLTVGNLHGSELEKLEDNWKKYQTKSNEITDDLEKIISK